MRTRQLAPLVLGSLFAFASPTWAETRAWHDALFGKDWALTPTGDEVLLLFAPGVPAEARAALAARERLTETHGFDAIHRTAVYRVAESESAELIASRLATRVELQGAAPAVRDGEGFTKYYVPGQLTVQFAPGLDDVACRARITAAGSTVLEDYWTPGYYKISSPAGSDLFAAIREWYQRPEIRFAEPVYMCYDDALHVPNDPLFVNQWSERNTGQQGSWTPGADVQAVEAWDLHKGSPNVVVAIIDTGMDLNHEDLAPNLLPRNGDDWDFGDPNDSSPDDDGDHGTACSGIAAAVQDNAKGVSGIAPQCRLMPLRINLSSGQNANRADAINYAASRRADFDGLVMSCSWRMSQGDFTAVQAAIVNGAASDCVMCFATGNDNGPVSYPAKYPETVAVGASSPCDQRKSPSSCDGENFWGSNFGPEVDVVAPGVKIYTTDRTGGVGYSGNNYVTTFNGTSSATPLAAGVCALIWSANPGLTALEVRAILESTAEDQVGPPSEDTPGWDQYMGFGRINAYLALQAAQVPESFEDDMEAGEDPWTHSVATVGWNDAWHRTTERNHTDGGQYSWKCGAEGGGNYTQRINASLISPTIIPLPDSRLSFWHTMDAETFDPTTAADGGVIELSTNGGTSWVQLTPIDGYSHEWGTASIAPFVLGTPVFSGTFDWEREVVDLSAYAGTQIKVRFRFGSRSSIPPGGGGIGWFIDDFEIAPPGASGVESEPRELRGLALRTAEPNPFREQTTLRFALPSTASIEVRVFDLSGREVRRESLGQLSVGEHDYRWDGRDDSARPLRSGVYFIRVSNGAEQSAQRVLLLR